MQAVNVSFIACFEHIWSDEITSQAMQKVVRDVRSMRLFLERKGLKSLGEDLSKSLHVECRSRSLTA